MTLSDDQSDITDVCIDDDPPGGDNSRSTGGDTDVGETITDGVATFNLSGGATVLYEGTYSVAAGSVTPTGNPPNVEVTDTVTAEARINPSHAEALLTKTAMATCDVNVDGSVGVTKGCTAAVNAAGDMLDVSITGTVSNTGDVVIEDVTLTDLSITSLIIDGGSKSNGAFDLGPGDSVNYTETATETVLTHSNTITASAINGFTDAAVPDATATATCGDPKTPSISVDKYCSVVLDFSTDFIQLKVAFSGQICNTSDLKLINLTTSDSLSGDITLDRDYLAPMGEDDDCLDYSGFYFPSETDGGENPAPGDASFSSTVTVNAQAALIAGVEGEVEDTDDASCNLCPDCPDCPDQPE